MKVWSFVIIIILFLSQFCIAQTNREYKTWNPANDTLKVLEGQAWPGEVSGFFDRLPAKAEQFVRKDVWNLSKNTAGLKVRFQTNADEIIVRYIVAGSLQMPHMPATGVSGIDMYSKTIDGKWLWTSGKYSFADTIVYRFSNLTSNDGHVLNREYHLYLPLYNSVKWMEIKVPTESLFKPMPARQDKPIVVYGTSIVQGACASRPGLAWTNILERKMDRPLINLGFSGNGRLEKELIDLIAEKDAQIYVLDCLPNLVSQVFTAIEIRKRITEAVRILQLKRPGIPILLTDHSGYTDEEINLAQKRTYQYTNTAFKQAFDSMLSAGVKNIYRLSKEALSQDIETMVDGSHPNDIGMMRYAEAYNKMIRIILNEQVGNISTVIPVTQRRDAAVYDWETRHNEVIQYNKTHSPQLVFIGNSITHFWGGSPEASINRGIKSWLHYFEPLYAVNLGYGWDRIENVLWRVHHGELDHIAPMQIVLMIGTNNLHLNTNKEIIEGLQFLVKAIQFRQPAANILLMGILPRRGMEARIITLNKLIAGIPATAKVKYADAARIFLQRDKKIDESLFSDGLHPNAAGYEKLGAFILTQLINAKNGFRGRK